MTASPTESIRVIAGQKVKALGFQSYAEDLQAIRELVSSLPGDHPLQIVEVGSWVGESALTMIEGAGERGATIYCVDTWRGCPNDATGPLALSAGGTDGLFNLFKRNIGPYYGWAEGKKHIVMPLQESSPGAAVRFVDGGADLVYIDADHKHDAVVSDVQAWRRVVRKGGILCGHDWDQVEQAVRTTGVGPIRKLGDSVWAVQR